MLAAACTATAKVVAKLCGVTCTVRCGRGCGCLNFTHISQFFGPLILKVFHELALKAESAF